MSMQVREMVEKGELVKRNGRILTVDGERYKPKADYSGPPAKQAFRDQCDINKIIAKYNRTGMIEHVNKNAPFYGDVSDIADYQSALNLVIKADELFANMSSAIRERFDNDATKMIAFLQNKDNLDEAIKLGMVLKKPEPVPEPIAKMMLVDESGKPVKTPKGGKRVPDPEDA